MSKCEKCGTELVANDKGDGPLPTQIINRFWVQHTPDRCTAALQARVATSPNKPET